MNEWDSVVELNLFTRWLLKHYETSQDEDGSFCYRNAIGEIVEIEDIVTHFNEEVKAY